MHLSIPHMFGLKKVFKLGLADSKSQRDAPETIEGGSENDLRRQLIQVLLHDSMRRHGIPPSWLDCQMLLVSSRSRGEGMYVRLIMRHWDLRLLTYAVAFQQSLMTDILRFEPHASQWLHGISWQLEVGDSCPYTELPDRSVWEEHPTPADASTDVMKDLERMFAIRDADMLVRGAEAAHQPSTAYAKTQPMSIEDTPKPGTAYAKTQPMTLETVPQPSTAYEKTQPISLEAIRQSSKAGAKT